jgi:hypothetical protein
MYAMSISKSARGSGHNRLMATDELPASDLAHPSWLRNALANPKRIWNSYTALMQREDARAEARKRSRESLGADTNDQNPFSIWNA